jgi:glycosyltransferase involved in cell wall biosynthesis
MVPMTNPVPSPARPSPVVDAIAIGRNEGARLDACLASLAGRVRRTVYVDSGSTDGSPARAAEAGAQVVALDMGQPFTAARARNAGLAALATDPPDLVLTIDGDCTLQPGFLPAAIAPSPPTPAPWPSAAAAVNATPRHRSGTASATANGTRPPAPPAPAAATRCSALPP